MTTKTLFLLLPVLIAVLFFSCKKETPPTIPNNESPIQLQIEKAGSESELSWTETNTSSFEKYEIVMLDKPIATNFLDTATFYNSFIISDQRQNQLNTLLVPNADTMYYRLFVWIGNGYRVSNEVKIGFDNVTVINKRINNNSLFDNNTNTFFHYDYSIDSIFVLDYKNQVFNGHHFLGFDLSNSDIGSNGLNAELYTQSSSSYDILVLDLPNLNYVNSIVFNSFFKIKQLASNNNDLLAILLYQSAVATEKVSLLIINKITSDIFYEEEINSDEYRTFISFLPNDSNRLLVLKEDSNTVYQFDESGLVNRVDAEGTFNSIEPVFSPDGNYFVSGSINSVESSLDLFNSNLELITSLDVDYKDVTFSTDGSKIYLIAGGITNKFITIRSVPELELEETIPIPMQAEKLLINDNQLMIYGKPLKYDFEKHIFSVIEI